MILKSYIVEKNINVLDQYLSVLIYGQNTGIKDEIKSKIIQLNKNIELINIFEDTILNDKENFHHSVLNQSLFYTKKIFLINNATDKILPEIENYLKNENIKIYLFSENLEKKSKIRKLFEADKKLATFACYEDTEKTLIQYISNQLKEYKGLNGEICNLLISNCNMNRKEIQSEIENIKVLFQSKQIDKIKLFELLNQTSDTNFDDIRDNALLGNKKKLSSLLSTKNILNEDSFFYLSNLSFRIQKLIDVKNNINNNQIEAEIDKLKPPIFWKDKPVFINQLKKLSINKLINIYSKINTTEVLMKKNSKIDISLLIKNLLIDITSENNSIS